MENIQSQKDVLYDSTYLLLRVKFIESESRMVVARAWGGESESLCLMGTVSVWEGESVLEMDRDHGNTTV